MTAPRILHGTPITPKRHLDQLAGESFCVSFAAPEQLDDAIRLQDPEGMLMLDNGAFSHWRAGRGQIDPFEFFSWANAAQDACPVAVAVIPDVIQGTEAENWEHAELALQLSEYPERLMFVWHMDDSIANLRRAALLFNFVAIGSCGEYDIQKNKPGFLARLRHAMATIDYCERFHARRPWVHLMRGNGILHRAIRVDSSDSSNIARNHCRTKHRTNHVNEMARRVAAPILAACAGDLLGKPSGHAYPVSNY